MPAKTATTIVIKPPKFQTASFTIVGTAPYVQNKFSAKARAKMKADQEAGSTSRSRKQRAPRDFEADYQSATHRSERGEVSVVVAWS